MTKINHDGGDTTVQAFMDFFDALVEASLERIESRRPAMPNARGTGPLVRTREEAASDLAVSVRTLDALVREGRIKRRRVGGKWKFHVRDLEKYLESEG